ncbi:MAG: hypothetical protein KJ964_02465 [Verrucomicrobia bacterium]|nr:hypothetical protein [Verrucomicrobiota bacterium]MBU1734027.1 hypothetical protein [Verrucomicrobiota bacterium]MBU1857123.1 hypothetical protein [Verrucomicrobiota bacterium]
MNKNTGRIQLSEDGMAIEFRRGSQGRLYEIDLRQILSARDIVDWYYHLKDKVDVTPEILCDFMVAIEEACKLHFGADPRDLFCVGGQVKWPQ